MTLFSFDTETFLIRPGIQAPPVVCLQYCLGSSEPMIVHARNPATTGLLERALSDTTWVLNGHNVAYDMACIAATWPHLLPLIFRAYAEKRVICTKVVAQLDDISRGIPMDSRDYSLAGCVKRYLGEELDKTDPWRLKYGTLYNTPIEEWPTGALSYALKDAEMQAKLFRALPQMPDAAARSAVDFWLYLVKAHGIRTDKQRVEAYHAQTLVAAEKDKAELQRAGLIRPDGSRDTKVAKARCEAAYAALGETAPKTETGEISLDEDACNGSGDALLQAYQRFGSLKTTLKRCERLYYGTELPLQASFNCIVETGRTSCRMGDVKPGQSPTAWGFQLQNLPREE
jgi:DNA polymerase-1